jgi:hypothetical protein
MIDELKQKVIEARQDEAIGKISVEDYWKAVQETDAYKLWDGGKADLGCLTVAREMQEDALRQAALELYKLDGNTKPVPGVTVKMHHKMKYDLDKVVAWAEDKAKHLFKFDVKAFEKNPPENAPFEKVDEPYCELATKME